MPHLNNPHTYRMNVARSSLRQNITININKNNLSPKYLDLVQNMGQ